MATNNKTTTEQTNVTADTKIPSDGLVSNQTVTTEDLAKIAEVGIVTEIKPSVVDAVPLTQSKGFTPTIKTPTVSTAAKPVVELKAPVTNLYLSQVQDYMAMMVPKKPMTEADGARHQVRLYRAITGIINHVQEDFTAVFTELLRLFAENREGVFNEIYLYRFFEHIELNAGERKCFQRLINMLIAGAPVAGREIALRQINFEDSLVRPFITEAGRQRVLGAFNR